jgi:hypothetical protein
MMGKRFFFVLLAAALTGTLAYGCSSSNSGESGNDGGSSDATFDAVQHHDAAQTGDDGAASDDSSSAPACPTPVDEMNFMPPAYKHAKTVLGACSASDIAGYDAACLNSSTASQTNCTNFKNAHGTCFSCLESKSSDSTWGPLVSWNGVVSANVAGCIELKNPSDTACPQTIESSDECTHAACDSVCPVTNATSFASWQMCAQTADAQACGKYATPAQSCYMGDDAAATAVCNLQQYASFDDIFNALAPIFCGGGDAGTTPTDGGASDTGASDAPPG